MVGSGFLLDLVGKLHSCTGGSQQRLADPQRRVHEAPDWVYTPFLALLGYMAVGDWDVHWGYDLDFDPWPHMNAGVLFARDYLPRHVLS